MSETKELTKEESRKIFEDILDQMTTLLNKSLGKEEYACYINIIWDKQMPGKPNSYHSIHALSHPEAEDKVAETVTYLSQSLYEDPFVAGSVLHHTVSNFLDTNYNTSVEENDRKFKITGDDFKGVN